jgi:hypothetical protein
MGQFSRQSRDTPALLGSWVVGCREIGYAYPAVFCTKLSHGIGELEYHFHDRTIMITNCGRIRIEKRKINLGTLDFMVVREGLEPSTSAL